MNVIARCLPLSLVVLTGCFEADLTLAVGANGKTRYTVEAKLSSGMASFLGGMGREQATSLRAQFAEGVRDGVDARALRKQGVKVRTKTPRRGEVGATVRYEAKSLPVLLASDAELPAITVDALDGGLWRLGWPLGDAGGLPDLSALPFATAPGGLPAEGSGDRGSEAPPAQLADADGPPDGDGPEGGILPPSAEMETMTRQLLALIGAPRLGFHVQVPGTIEAIEPAAHGTFTADTASWTFTFDDLDASILEELASLQVRFRAPAGQAFPVAVGP